VLGQVAGEQDGARGGIHRHDPAHRIGEHPLGLVVVVADVRVAELDEEIGPVGGHAVVVSGRWRPTWPT
jgi:hypothetical protein